MHDKIEKLSNGTILQHGKLSDRIYIMKLEDKDASNILDTLSELSLDNNYSKIFCKIPQWVVPLFLSDGYRVEAIIPKFYNSDEDVFFVSKFLTNERLLNIDDVKLEYFSLFLKEFDKTAVKPKKLSKDLNIEKLESSDVEAITQLYLEVFETYPFPIHNPGYIFKTMQEDVHYFGIKKEGKLLAVASSEVDSKGKNAEMTDFATSKKHLGNGYAGILLKTMQKEMKNMGIKTLYTIARLSSLGMNKTFLNANYTYSGTLINNTNISGSIESMNVYYKHL